MTEHPSDEEEPIFWDERIVMPKKTGVKMWMMGEERYQQLRTDSDLLNGLIDAVWEGFICDAGISNLGKPRVWIDISAEDGSEYVDGDTPREALEAAVSKWRANK